MKKWRTFILALLVIMFVSFDAVKAASAAQPQEQNNHLLQQIEEKRAEIRKQKKENKKLENQIEKKSKKIDKLLAGLYENNLKAPEVTQNQISNKLEVVMNHLLQVGESEGSAWSHLNNAKKQFERKKYSASFKHLNDALNDLKQKQERMIIFNKDLDEFIVFINSLQHK